VEAVRSASTLRASSSGNFNRTGVVGHSVVSTIGIVSARQVNVAKPASVKVTEEEFVEVDLIASVI
jgi:hypothetical protein